MNPDSPIAPRSALESSLTALLLGELPHEQAAALHQKLAQDAELAKLYERLKHTINLVRETVASPAAQTANQPTPLKLSDQRRQKLLQQFKTVAPKQFAPPRRSAMSWLVPVGIAAVFVVLLASMLLPALSKAKSRSKAVAFRTWSLSEPAASAPMAPPVSGPSSEYGRLSADSRRGVKSQGVPRRLARMQPATEAPAKGNFGGAAIVLPPNSELADAPTTPLADDGVQLGATVTASTRGYYDDASGRSGGARGDVAFGGFRGRAPGGAATVEGRPTEIAANDDFFRVAPADSHAVAKVPLLAEGMDMTAGDLVAGGRVGGLSQPPAEAGKEIEFHRKSAAGEKKSDAAGQVLGLLPPQVEVKAKFAEVSQDDRKALGFDWYMGNSLAGSGSLQAPKGTMAPAQTGKSAGAAHFGIVSGDTQNLNYQWGYDSSAASSLADSDAEKPPILGDVPLAGRLFRSTSDTAASSVQANAGSFTTGQAKDELTTFGFVPALTEEKVKSVEFANSSVEREKSSPENEKPSQQNRGPYSLNVVGYYNVTLPKSGMVEIVDKALPASSPSSTLWEKLRGKAGEYKSTARIKVERDQSDISSMAAERGGTASYDPYFIQTESETIQSEAVLGKVIKDLNLNEAWGRKQGGGTLTTADTMALLKTKLDLRPVQNTSLLEIGVKSDQPEEAARIANAVAEEYKARRVEQRAQLSKGGIKALEERLAEQDQKIASAKAEAERLSRAAKEPALKQADVAPPKPAASAPIPQPEVQTAENNYSTFSLNVSDVAFKLAGASLEKGVMPEPATVRSEEFINAFDYRDPEPPAGVPVAFAWERAQYPFAQNRDLLRFSVKTAALGRQPGRPLNLVLLLDNSGSMERADRVRIIREALRALAGQLQPQDKFSVVTFSRTPRLVADGAPGSEAEAVALALTELTPEGGTNLEEAMNLAYQTALRHYLANGVNRVVLLTDGAANLGNVDPEALKQKVEANRKQGIALDCFGIGWEGYNDDLLEVLVRNGDGRYGFVNTPEDAATEFAGQLAGALRVAASDVKVQVEFNPGRVTAYRQIGYAKHQLTKEQFRDNPVDAAEIGAAESGNALYVVEVNPRGDGPLATVRVRYKVPGTSDYHEHEWAVPYTGNAVALEQASPAMRLAATASAFSEWLVSSPYAGEVTPDRLLGYFSGVPEVYGADARPKKLEWMIRQAKSIAGK